MARPLGALVFGHYGDRVGRKKLLVLSLLLMGAATFLIGCLPTHAAIGVAGPAAADRCSGSSRASPSAASGAARCSSSPSTATRSAAASGPPGRRRAPPAATCWPPPCWRLLAAIQTDEAFLSWGWRVPFLLSGVLVLVGLWIRLSISESPVFQQAVANAEPAPTMPIVEVFRYHWRDVITAIGARFAENVSYYILTAFVLVYATTSAGLTKPVVLNAVLIGSAVHFVSIPLWGALSDRLGRRPVYLLGAAGVGLWAFAFFPLIDTKNFGAVTLAVTVGLILHGAMYGPQAAFFSELFATRMRYSGVSIGAQLASIVAGGLAPLIAVALLSAYESSLPVMLYVIGAAVVTLITVYVSRETRGRDLVTLGSPDEAPATR